MSRIDILNAFSSEPARQDFVLPGFLVGTVGALISPGGAGKSFLALQLAAAIAGGTAQANTTGLAIHGQGKVLYLNLEDPPEEIQRRLFYLGQHFDLITRQTIAGNLSLSARQGISSNIMDPKFHAGLLKAAAGMRLVILDTLSRCHGSDENDNGQMAALIARLESISRQTGAAILFLHHTSKATALAGQGAMQQAARGASALIDNARFCASLVKMTLDDAEKWTLDGQPIADQDRGFLVRYKTGKQNYGQVEAGQWYQRGPGGILRPVSLQPANQVRKRGRAYETL